MSALAQHGKFSFVNRKIYERWCVVLGMVAMLGALVAVPLSASTAIAMAVAHDAHQAVAGKVGSIAEKKEMPCHGQKSAAKIKHCPNCPDKACPDLGNCLIKCFQQMTAPVSYAHLLGDVVHARVAPSPSRVNASSLIPPLLRPPSA